MKDLSPFNLDTEVIVADDDPLVTKLVSRILRDVGFKAEEVNELEGFDVTLLSPQCIIILDLLLPNTDGIEFLRHLAASKMHNPVILLSGLSSKAISMAKAAGQAYGINIVDTLSKPINKARLVESVVQASKLPARHSADNSQKIMIEFDEIVDGLKRDEFVPFYQPQIDLESFKVSGLESLIRWNHPVHGLLGPYHFIDIVESSELVEEFTLMAVEKSIKGYVYLSQAVGYSGLLSVNIPSVLLRKCEISESIINVAARYNVDPSRIQLEITESSSIDDYVQSLDIQARLVMRGFNLSIDDFGTGFSGIERLSSTYFDEIKIDKFFIQKTEKSEKYKKVVLNMIDLGHQLGMRVVAEGVENHNILSWLIFSKCDVAQGFYISIPKSLEDLESWLKDEAQYIAKKLGHNDGVRVG